MDVLHLLASFERTRHGTIASKKCDTMQVVVKKINKDGDYKMRRNEDFGLYSINFQS